MHEPLKTVESLCPTGKIWYKILLCFQDRSSYFINPIPYHMAQYSKGAGKKVADAMHEMKEGKLTSGRSGKKVTSRQQAIAIGLSEAKESGEKVPAKKSAAKQSRAGSKTAAKSGATTKGGSKTAAKKGASKRGLASASTATKKAVARKGGSASSKKSS